MSHFACKLCEGRRDLLDLAGELCDDCMVCFPCAAAHLQAQVNRQLSPPSWPPILRGLHKPHEYSKGEHVLYRQQQVWRPAQVVQVDRSVHPPQLGIVLEPVQGQDANVRYTEFDRLRPLNEPALYDIPKAPRLSSPCCSRPLTLAQLKVLSPDAHSLWETACNDLWLRMNNILRCPAGCGALIECQQQQQQQQRTGQTPHERHKQRHRFRCTMCTKNFCDACLAVPYHDGLSCEEHAMPDCLYCGCKVALPAGGQYNAQAGGSGGASRHGTHGSTPATPTRPGSGRPAGTGTGAGHSPGPGRASNSANGASASSTGHAPVTTLALKAQLGALGVEYGHCIEKSELQALLQRFQGRVCSAKACRSKLLGACTRRLPCGHWCVGVRGEAHCPPCVSCPAPGTSPSGKAGLAEPADDPLCPLCLSSLPPGPAIQLSCSQHHMCHLDCAKARLEVGPPGPELSFGHLFCPVCRERDAARGNVQVATGPVHMDHPQLQGQHLDRWLELRTEVATLAKAQLRAEGLLATEPLLQPGGAFDGRPADFAISRFTFYECSRCNRPFFGGARACRAANPELARAELVCGGCSVVTGADGDRCRLHDANFIEWKCKYCCSPASWFCWGTTHMCNDCHDQPTRRQPGRQACDPRTCALGIRHPQPGEEFCLGCGLCRRSAAAGRAKTGA